MTTDPTDSVPMPSRERFVTLVTRLGAATPAAVWYDALVERYSEPHRRYHTVEGRASLEIAARANLSRALGELGP